jgi:hypothetical protein
MKTEKQNILDRLIAGETVREIKTALKIGAEKIQWVREANPDLMPKKPKKRKPRTGTRTRTGTKNNDSSFIKGFKILGVTFTEEEKNLAKRMFRTILRHRSIKVQDEENYQKLIDKITGD